MVLSPTEISISLDQRGRHHLLLEVRTPDLEVGEYEFAMPVWTPGSYLVREYARHVEDVQASIEVGAQRRVLECEKVAKNRWRVVNPQRGDVVLNYAVYCRDLTVRTNYVDSERAYWNGAATYIVARERFDAPFRVRVLGDLRTHVSLPEDEDASDAFFAGTMDEVVDAPFVCVRPDDDVREFEACGVRHVCLFDGVYPEVREGLTHEIRSCVEASARIFGGALPYDGYHFFVFADHGGSGGLEHANSCVLHLPRTWFRGSAKRNDRISLFAHEHFHAWNGKRIRPAELATFDYESENYTRDLWLAEGVTSFYQEVVPMRAGLFDRQTTLDRLARVVHEVESRPGRDYSSVGDASFDAWIKLYRPDENTRNSSVDYYDHGAVVTFALDALIQSGSAGAHDFDDVLRELWAHACANGPGQSRDLVIELCSRFAGRDLSTECLQLLEGRGLPPLDEWLAEVGLRLERPSGSPVASLDVTTKLVDGRLEVAQLARDGAGAALGLSPGDEILAVDGERVRAADFTTWLEDQFDVGSRVRVLVARRGRMIELTGTLGGRHTGVARMREFETKQRWR